jgi:hypothetical protein
MCYKHEHYGYGDEYNEKPCEMFKNKADYAEVVRCGKCKHGDVSTISKSRDGQEEIACYCTLKKATTDVDCYCPSGERSDA